MWFWRKNRTFLLTALIPVLCSACRKDKSSSPNIPLVQNPAQTAIIEHKEAVPVETPEMRKGSPCILCEVDVGKSRGDEPVAPAEDLIEVSSTAIKPAVTNEEVQPILKKRKR